MNLIFKTDIDSSTRSTVKLLNKHNGNAEWLCLKRDYAQTLEEVSYTSYTKLRSYKTKIVRLFHSENSQ